jgi:RHH-type proline utilization regulon transcriptional repressor/proline dehydrogenase/delta 1-pyrroline-5-carboxylate dehydrogenase
MAGLAGESNELRYRPFSPGVVVRASEDTKDAELLKAVALGTITSTPVKFSLPGKRPCLQGVPTTVESEESLVASLAEGPGQATGQPAGRTAPAGRLRLLGEASPSLRAATAGAGLSVLDEPICSCGRIELVRWLREQVVTRSLHRYGDVIYDRW